tara:strand:- start:1047 stop:2207 length:1161 start_codon:yes stop_codon:yes gene_type:complete
MTKIIKRLVDSLSPQDKDYFIWDSEVSGFGLRVFATGRKSYLIQYRVGNRTRRMTIGAHGVLTPDEARKEARALLVDVAKGGNPSEEKRLYRHAPTVEALCERFMKDYVPYACKPSTQKEYRRNVDLFIIPALGKLKIKDVARADISKFHQSLKNTRYQANRALGVLSKIFNLAEEWGLRPDGSNPCRHVKKFKEEKRERYLSPNELSLLGKTLRKCEEESTESPYVIAALRLLLLTGCRLGEIQTLKWDYIQGNCLRLPDSKTGAKKVYLGEAALDILTKIEKVENNQYVIVGNKEGQHITDMQKPWRRIRTLANLEGVRMHDFRHTFASGAVSGGESLHMTGKLLGHSQPQTTARYAHLADDPVHSAAERVSGAIANALLTRGQ